MRHAPTAAEARLFQALRAGKVGAAVRRQVPLLGRFIADLFVPEVRLVVEVDGGYHAEREQGDARRDRALEATGYTVLRVTNDEVARDVSAVVERVRAEIERLRREA